MNHEMPGAMTSSIGAGTPGVCQRIMVVDDSATARLMVESLLRESGFETLGVPDGPAALLRFPEFQPDLIVLDILMPGMDGLEVCRRIRELEGSSGIPVLFLTGDERVQTQEQAILVGGDDLIYKPSIQRELVIRARSLLRIRRLQTELERESRSLKELQTSQEGLFRFIVHDLKSPLQVILSGAEMVMDDPKNAVENARVAKLIQEGAILMDRMVQDILVVCHQGHLAPIHEAIALHEAVVEWTEGLKPNFAKRNVTLLNEIPDGMVVEADPELLRRCVLNLMENALKYGPKGNEVRVLARSEGPENLLRIEDRGPGIPPGMEEFIFDPFARLDRDASLARVSSGLGLAFCREVAHAHGGRIWVEPAHPGAAFCLALPTKA